jgi:hypothetical protein
VKATAPLSNGGIGAFFQRVLRHTRTPRSLPALLWKNITYSLASRRPEYWQELGRDLAARGRDEEALECYERALVLKPDVPELLNSRGNVLRSLGRFHEAETSLRHVLKLKPDFAGAHFDLGNILYSLGRATEAQTSYRTALRLQPDMPRVHFRLGLALLKAGQFEEGWKGFERRWRVERMIPPLSKPSWNGGPIGDRDILLFAHEAAGYGDTIQFCRYVPQIATAARRVILAVQPSLVRLLSRLPGVSEVIALGSQPPFFDLQCAIMRLPYAAGTTLESIPAATPYVAADLADIANWRKRLAGAAGPRVGLCWAGERRRSPGQLAWDRRRSITLDTLAPLGEISGVRFISLQKGPPALEAACRPPRMELHDFTEDLHDFADTAALVENLDLVISVDTAVAHLAGALGKPVWLLNTFDACWRWLLNRDDSPWYPSLRQFRQPAPGDWHSVISRARDALQRLADGDQRQLRPPTLSG